MILHLIQNRKNKWNFASPHFFLVWFVFTGSAPSSSSCAALPAWRQRSSSYPSWLSMLFPPLFSLLSPFLPQASSTALLDFILRHCRSEGKGQFIYYIHVATHATIHV